MTLRDAAGWKKTVDANTDPYGKTTIDYAERWANLMEERTAGDETLLSSIAKQASHDANVEEITRFMYACAVSMLSQVWQHGEALRRWYNLDIQTGHEGERANEAGGVLNPALLSIGGDLSVMPTEIPPGLLSCWASSDGRPGSESEG